MDTVDRKVAAQIYGMVVEAYGLPGHLRPCQVCGQVDEFCECGDDDE